MTGPHAGSDLRAGGAQVEGKNAACVSCHRRSGLGIAEGRVVIPPITGQDAELAAVQRVVAGTLAASFSDTVSWPAAGVWPKNRSP